MHPLEVILAALERRTPKLSSIFTFLSSVCDVTLGTFQSAFRDEERFGRLFHVLALLHGPPKVAGSYALRVVAPGMGPANR